MLKQNWKCNEPEMTPFGMGGGNYILKKNGFYFSYNPSVGENVFDRILDIFGKGNVGGEETALVIEKEDNNKYIVLSGDFRKEAETVEKLDDAVTLWNKLKVDHAAPGELNPQ